MKVHSAVSLLSLFVVAALALPTLAADTAPQHGQKLQDMVAQLNLSPDQQTKADAILSDMKTQVKSARQEAKASGDTAAAHTKIESIRHDAMKKLNALLTDDQKSQLHDMLKQAKAQHQAEKAGNATTQPTQQ